MTVTIRNSGTDYTPQSWSTPAPTQFLQDAFNPDYPAWYAQRPVPTPAYPAFELRGPSSEYLRQVAAFGLVTFTVRTVALRSKETPPFADVWCNGCQYKIQIGQAVSLPKCVYDTLVASGTYSATLA